MKFIVILICIVINRYWVGSHPLHTEKWFGKAKNKLSAIPFIDDSSPHSQLILVVLLPVLVTGTFLWAIQSWFWGMIWMFLSLLVLCYAIGISELEKIVQDQTIWLRKLTPEDSLEDTTTRHNEIMEKMVHDEFASVYPILFWFIVVGPGGALLYRLAQQYGQSADVTDSESRFINGLIRTLDWIPVRITGLAFCVIGDFSRCMGLLVENLLEWTRSPKTVLIGMAQAAIYDLEWEPIDVVNYAVKAEYELKEVAKLLQRTLLFWIALVAVLTLLGLV